MLYGRTPLYAFEKSTFTGRRYKVAVFESYVHLFRGLVGPDLILLDNNARPHRAHQRFSGKGRYWLDGPDRQVFRL